GAHRLLEIGSKAGGIELEGPCLNEPPDRVFPGILPQPAEAGARVVEEEPPKPAAAGLVVADVEEDGTGHERRAYELPAGAGSRARSDGAGRSAASCSSPSTSTSVAWRSRPCGRTNARRNPSMLWAYRPGSASVTSSWA